MAEQRTPPDALTMWREWAQQGEEQWNQFFNQVMGTEAFAATMGRSMEMALAMQTRLAQQFENSLKAWNLPTRSDLVAIAERLTLIEERLDRLTDLVERERGTGGSSRQKPAP